MSQYRVKMIIDGRSTSIIISAYNAGDAAKLARAMYAGNNIRVLETNRIR